MTPRELTPREQLILLLARLDRTNAEAAKLLGIAESTLYRWLAGTSKVPTSALLALNLMGETK
jgi:hypothetical protein